RVDRKPIGRTTRKRSRPRSVHTRTRSPLPPSARRSMRRSPRPVPTISSSSRARFTPRGRPLTTSVSVRHRIGFILRYLSRPYLPAGDLHEGETALAKIVAETEEPFTVPTL